MKKQSSSMIKVGKERDCVKLPLALDIVSLYAQSQ